MGNLEMRIEELMKVGLIRGFMAKRGSLCVRREIEIWYLL